MTVKELVDALRATGEYEVIRKDDTERVKCWICEQWQGILYTRTVSFNGMGERVCLQCRSLILEREADLQRYKEDDDE